MSWSLSFIGKPENISEALDKHSAELAGASRDEFDAARPHMQGLLAQNFGYENQLVKLTASGHGSFNADGKQVTGQCSVSIEGVYGEIV